ncbi:DNA modification methylase [Candidatus Nomurabacteria bacterium]|nr:DNA modification methylase [Candidatus Nomurabacteria bacterium]
MAKQKLVWRTERRKVKDLIRYGKNPRKLTDSQLEGLKRSLNKFNVAELPCINTDGTLVAGNQRVLALSLLGREEEEIEVRVPNRPLTKAEFRDYLLTSNRSGGTWDYEKLASDFNIDELLLAGFESQDLSFIFDDNLEIVNDEFDEKKEVENAQDTNIKPGDYFSLGRHRLMCGNALDPETVKQLTNGVRIDLINDDPPFNIGLSYDKGVGNKAKYGGTTNDNKSDDEYQLFIRTIMQNALSVAKPDAHVMFWTDERYVWLFQQLYRELGVDSKRLCIWIKDNQSPTPKVAFNKVTEYCVYGTVGKPYLNDSLKNLNEVINKEVSSGNRLTDDILDLFNIWLVKRIPGSEYEHPTQKNPTLHEKALRRCTKPGDTVLDLTAGSGSILSACEQLKRTAYLNEIEPVFCQVIINRFKKLSHEPVTKLN